MADDGWRDYLDRFHADAAGVTERMLLRSRDDGIDPYRWAAERVRDTGTVVDLGCGSAPLADDVDRDRYVGVDRSAAELRVAAQRGARVVRGDATAVPLPDASAGTVTCLMALMLIRPLDAVVAEIHRIAAPGGQLIALLPASMPDGVADVLRWAALLTALGRVELEWPNPQTLGQAVDWLGPDLTVIADETRTFDFPITGDGDAQQFVASLYLRGIPVTRQERAERIVDAWLGRKIGIPLRRLVAVAA